MDDPNFPSRVRRRNAHVAAQYAVVYTTIQFNSSLLQPATNEAADLRCILPDAIPEDDRLRLAEHGQVRSNRLPHEAFTEYDPRRQHEAAL
jgi:hypothetical protein